MTDKETNSKHPLSYYGSMGTKLRRTGNTHKNNIGIVAHIDHGRTTETSAIAYARRNLITTPVLHDIKTASQPIDFDKAFGMKSEGIRYSQLLNHSLINDVDYSTDKYNDKKEAVTRKKNKAKRKKKTKHLKRNKR